MRRNSSFFTALMLLLACACTGGKYETFSGYAQGGTYRVKVNMQGVRVSPETVAAAIDSLLEAIDFSISGYNRNSLLSKRNAGEEIVPDRYFSELLELSEKYKELSGGAFDVYSGPLFDLWGFGFTSDSLPSDEAIERALADCKAGKILNFNAIAQGYSCDIVAEYLYSIGVKDMLVDIGEIFCDGRNPSGKGWSIGVDNPVDGNDSPGSDLRGIWRSNGAAQGIVTSGNYRKFYVKDGKKYAHTIDPRSGRPVEHGLLSASVVAPTAAEADALATACMVLGPQGARELVEALDGVEAYLIFADGVWTSEGFNLEQ
ncbi:MAG: FAD:protein FMN transferase [Candidatus Cryptobacteroides sp.]|nr:FAD:protein FMN transferase [Bacteroidales bacterium]MDY6158113.1 FAD:protein FMN transferase [Candidatus Cryptobacteroides sp.]